MSEQAENSFAPPELPRLQIIHLLALTAIFSLVMAVGMSLMRLSFAAYQGTGTPEISGVVSGFLILNGLSSSVCIAIVVLGLVWRKQGIAFPSQHGHWVALYLTLAYVFDTARNLLPLVMVPDHAELMVTFWQAMSFVFHSLAAVLWIAAYRRELARIWKWGWAAMALRSILAASLHLFYVGTKYIEWLLEVFWYNSQFDWQPFQFLRLNADMLLPLITLLPNYALLAFVSAATVSDFRHNRQRHWSHWLVIILLCVSSAAHLAYHHWPS